MDKGAVLRQLVEMSRSLAAEGREYAILGEGNTSARVDDETFFVKASGTELRTITARGFVEVRAADVLAMLDAGDLADDDIRDRLAAACLDRSSPLRPSVETVLHALLLQLPHVRFVGHTHPVSVNSILCAADGADLVQGRIFPDEIVCCGIAPCYVPYTDPGVPLARQVQACIQAYSDQWAEPPRAILMQNHGLIAAGSSPADVESITAMWDKTARILLGTMAAGGPRYLTDAHVRRIHTRPDEAYRKRLIRGREN